MNNTDILFSEIDQLVAEQTIKRVEIQDRIERELHAQYADWGVLQAAIERLECCEDVRYGIHADNLIYSWIRFSELSNVPEREREYLDTYLTQNRGLSVDWDSTVLIQYLGDDEILVVDDTRSSNGVYQSGALIIEEDDYIIDGDCVDETMRNQLIEAHLEKTGYYPGIYRVTCTGDVYPVSTQGGGK